MRQAGREEFYYTDLNYITFCQISAPQTHLTWYPYIYWLCFSLLSVIAEKFKSVFFFWSNLLVRSVSSRHPFRKSTEGRDFLTRIIPDLCQFLFPALFQTRWLGPSVQTCCAHTSGRKKKILYIHNTPHSYIPKSSVCASLCVSASTEIQSLQSTSDLICRARPTHWDDSLEPAPTNSDWQRRNLGCLPRQ